MQNPFETIETKLAKLEDLLITLTAKTTKPSEELGQDLLRYIPIQEIFKRKICSKPTFYEHLKKGEFTLYKFGNKSFVDRQEFEKAFRGVKLNPKNG